MHDPTLQQGFLARILDRKRREVERRARRAEALSRALQDRPIEDRASRALRALRRRDGALRILAEVKFASPSAGTIRERAPGEAVRVARAYAAAGAAAVSVLCDRPGFNGTPLDVRRVAAAIDPPVLFKGFVLDPVQVALARAMGASMVLLLVRALPDAELASLSTAIRDAGMEPVVEAKDAAEVARALAAGARIVGVNSRDLETFRVDRSAALDALSTIPKDRVAVLMSGVREPRDVRMLAASRADAILVGEALMRAGSPGDRLALMLAETTR